MQSQEVEVMGCNKQTGVISDTLGYYILWWIIFAILTYLVLYSLRPTFVTNPETGVVDTGKVLLASIVISLIIVFIIWLIKRSTSSC